MDATVLYVRSGSGRRAPPDVDGLSIAEVTTAAAARDAAAAGRVDAAVVEADECGVGPVAAVRAADPTVPVVACSGTADGDLAARATRQGADEYYPREEAAPSLSVRVRATLEDEGDAPPGDVANPVEPYAETLEPADDGVYALDEEGHFEFVNPEMVELTGYSREELFGAPADLIMDDDSVEEAREAVHELADSEERLSGLLETSQTLVAAQGCEEIARVVAEGWSTRSATTAPWCVSTTRSATRWSRPLAGATTRRSSIGRPPPWARAGPDGRSPAARRSARANRSATSATRRTRSIYPWANTVS